MNYKITDGVRNILKCPACGGALRKSDQGFVCDCCEAPYEYTESGALDLRFSGIKTYPYEFKLGTPLLPAEGFEFGVLTRNDAPEVDYSNFDVPHHLSPELISHFPKAKPDGGLMLDLGCGTAIHRDVCEHAAFEYVGLDYDTIGAPIFGDAHSLPFKDESFDFVLSVAVLEHIRFPFVMMKEVNRVLKPDGVFIGSVAFLEPFHQGSFYHHTHLGTFNSLKESGLKIEAICPSKEWSILVAQATMGLFPKMPRFLSKLIVLPVQAIHKVWWWVGGVVSNKATEGTRIRNTTGAFTFIARKEVG